MLICIHLCWTAKLWNPLCVGTALRECLYNQKLWQRSWNCWIGFITARKNFSGEISLDSGIMWVGIEEITMAADHAHSIINWFAHPTIGTPSFLTKLRVIRRSRTQKLSKLIQSRKVGVDWL